jgi:hypothetical protein
LNAAFAAGGTVSCAARMSKNPITMTTKRTVQATVPSSAASMSAAMQS